MKKILVLIVLLVFIIESCTTTKNIDKVVPIETINTEYINKLYRDSVFIHDSIDRYIQGDTVFQTKYKYIYRQINKIDTVIKTDTIPKIVTVEKIEVKEVNKIKWWQNILIYSGIAFITSAVIFVYRKIRTII